MSLDLAEDFPPATGEHAANIKRLRWRCRRGMKEMDLLLGRFLDHLLKGDQNDLQGFERLLTTEDDQLWRWLVGNGTSEDQELAIMVERIRAFACA